MESWTRARWRDEGPDEERSPGLHLSKETDFWWKRLTDYRRATSRLTISGALLLTVKSLGRSVVCASKWASLLVHQRLSLLWMAIAVHFCNRNRQSLSQRHVDKIFSRRRWKRWRWQRRWYLGWRGKLDFDWHFLSFRSFISFDAKKRALYASPRR